MLAKGFRGALALDALDDRLRLWLGDRDRDRDPERTEGAERAERAERTEGTEPDRDGEADREAEPLEGEPWEGELWERDSRPWLCDRGVAEGEWELTLLTFSLLSLFWAAKADIFAGDRVITPFDGDDGEGDGDGEGWLSGFGFALAFGLASSESLSCGQVGMGQPFKAAAGFCPFPFGSWK